MNSENLSTGAERIESAILKADLPAMLREQITSRLSVPPFRDSYVAVRSSGTDEDLDPASHSFAGEKEEGGRACVRVCLRACVCACVYACVCACVCVSVSVWACGRYVCVSLHCTCTSLDLCVCKFYVGGVHASEETGEESVVG